MKHAKQSKKMYQDYKYRQSRIEKYLENPRLLFDEPNETLLSVMFRCNKVAKTRRDYQDIFYLSPDPGHEKMIRQLIALSDDILQLLTTRFELILDISSSEESRSLEISSSSIEDPTFELALITTGAKKLSMERFRLEIELKTSIERKQSNIIKIKEIVQAAIHRINPYLRGGELLADEKASFLVCSMPIVRTILSNTIGDCDGFGCQCALVDWEIYPQSADEIAEAIYQHRAPVPILSDAEIDLRCLGMLIDEARERKCSFTYHYKLTTVKRLPTWSIVIHPATKETIIRFRKARDAYL
ncbi:Hypothetical protein POVR1_LOCUS174 [uncultured virus]|nr:Hypothetical protein POVR1_LOCUS174 [uncultured virus]